MSHELISVLTQSQLFCLIARWRFLSCVRLSDRIAETASRCYNSSQILWYETIQICTHKIELYELGLVGPSEVNNHVALANAWWKKSKLTYALNETDKNAYCVRIFIIYFRDILWSMIRYVNKKSRTQQNDKRDNSLACLAFSRFS